MVGRIYSSRVSHSDAFKGNHKYIYDLRIVKGFFACQRISTVSCKRNIISNISYKNYAVFSSTFNNVTDSL